VIVAITEEKAIFITLQLNMENKNSAWQRHLLALQNIENEE